MSVLEMTQLLRRNVYWRILCHPSPLTTEKGLSHADNHHLARWFLTSGLRRPA